jgi:ornithine cyclodeaminase
LRADRVSVAEDNVGILILNEEELKRALAEVDAIDAVEHAFATLALGKANLPGVISLEIPEKEGEYHIKGAYLEGAPYVVFKSANSYYRNPAKGLPSSAGLFLAFDAETGFLSALMFDNSLLTHARTGAAGAVAAKYLARENLDRVAFMGCGTQARHQLEYLRRVRHFHRVTCWDRDRRAAETFSGEIAAGGIEAEVASDAKDAVAGSDLIVTVTPSTEPFVKADWIVPGMHITAVGADSPTKQELDENIFGLADVIIADRLSQCVERGEIHHAVEKGVIAADDVTGELGDVILGKVHGRTSPDEITVCDLTGVGVQDAAIASVVLAKAIELGLGKEMR